MKKALIGLSNNISTHYNKIKVWAYSFRKYCPDAKIYLLCANSNDEEINIIKSFGISAIPVKVEDTWYINHKRLIHIHNLFDEIEEEHLLITDVFDVVFQNNPFNKLDFVNYDVFVGQEGVCVYEEPWNTDNINKIFPEHRIDCAKLPVVCSGVIAGKKSALKPVYKRLFDLCERGSNNHNIKDQAALHVMIAHNEIPRFKQFNLNEGWTMHCAIAGPTQFFVSWGFKGALERYNLHIPCLEDGIVKTNGKAYDIVHQFNRIAEWNDILTQPYVE